MSEIFMAFPLFSIICCFVGAVLCSFLNKKASFIISVTVCVIAVALNACVLAYVLHTNENIIYTMGHFGPNEDGIRICNEIRVGPVEAFLALFFATILALVIIGGKVFQRVDIKESKLNLFYVLMCLILVSNMALLYTNDIFTAFVFIELSTLASCGCLMVKEKGPTILSTVRYMIFNLVGSGLFLIGIVILFDLTGYLSIENMATAIKEISTIKELRIPMFISFGLIISGLSIKSGLFPFHYWMPDAYGCATPTSSSILSGIVTKGYLFLLVKCIFRMFTIEVLTGSGLLEILFIFGVVGMVVGSINAIHQKSIDRMIAFSSAAQIGYIFMGIGLSGHIGVQAASSVAFLALIFHVLTHAVTKPLLFISGRGLISAAKGAKKFRNMRGIGRVDIVSAVCFAVGAFSMIGFPLLAGFISKYLYVSAAIVKSVPMWMQILAILALITSTVLNAIYFIRTCLTIFQPLPAQYNYAKIKYSPSYSFGLFGLVAANLFLGLGSSIILNLLQKGFQLFS